VLGIPFRGERDLTDSEAERVIQQADDEVAKPRRGMRP
jgi:hypothetical protein